MPRTGDTFNWVGINNWENPIAGEALDIGGWNALRNDLKATLSASLARDGTGTMSGAFKAASGTEGAPGITFSADPTTGVYRHSGGALGFAQIGVTTQLINNTALTTYTPIQAPTASASAPSYSFTGDADTGLWHSAADEVSITCAGANRYAFGTSRLSSSAVWQGPDGDATAPGVAFSNEVNTGFWRSGAGVVDLTLAGSNYYEFKSTGFSAAAPVIVPAGSQSTPSYTFSGDLSTGIYRVSAGQVGLSLGGTNQYTFTASGLTGPATAVSTDDLQYASNRGVLDAIKKIASFASLTNTVEILTYSAGATEIGGWTAGPSAYSEVTAATNGRLTANTTGTYRLDVIGGVSAMGVTDILVEARVDGASLSPPVYALPAVVVNGNEYSISTSVILALTAGSYVSLYRNLNTVTDGILSNARMSLQRIA